MKKTAFLLLTSSLLVQSMDRSNRSILRIDLNRPALKEYQSNELLQPSYNNGILTYNLNELSQLENNINRVNNFITAKHCQTIDKNIFDRKN